MSEGFRQLLRDDGHRALASIERGDPDAPKLTAVEFRTQFETAVNQVLALAGCAHPGAPFEINPDIMVRGSREALSLTPPRRKLRSALRRSIWPDIRAAKDIYVAHHGDRVPCAVTGTTLRLRGQGSSDAHIDHRPPNTFVTIASAFIAEREITDFAALLAPHDDNDMGDRLVDPAIALAFRQLHWSLAELDFLTSAATISAAARLPRHNPPHIILHESIPRP